MEKALQHKMVYMYLKDRKKESEVKQFSVNGKDGIIKIEFFDHEKATNFYEDANFVEKILIRPFNIYFNLTLTEPEMKKFYLEGITEDNQRKLFLECRKVGYCKLYTNYSSGPRGKLKPNGVLSFIRREPIPENDVRTLTENLKALGIKIQTYIHDKGLKCSINILNFYEGDINREESIVQEEAEEKVRELIGKMTEEVPSNVSVIVKRKEAVADRVPSKVVVTALVEYPDVEKTMSVFEKMRDYLVDKGQTKAILFFHNEENNSYLSLFTPGLSKPNELSEKEFEVRLLKDFRLVNINVIQVNVFKVDYNNTYIGRVYLKTEEDGKDFIIDYSSKRGNIFRNYRETNAPITFNINIDTKTLRKIKQAEKKARETEDKIKKQSEANRRDTNRHPVNKFPLGGMGVPNLGMLPNMPMTPGMIPMMSGNLNSMIPPMSMPINMPNLPSLPGIPGLNPYTPASKILPPMGSMGGSMIPQPPLDVKGKIKQILRDRENFLAMDTQSARRFLSEPIKYCMEEAGISTGQEASVLTNLILKENDVSTLIRFLENPTDLKASLQKYRH